MNLDRVKQLAGTLLYEGYNLYPYRATAIKNQQRFNFGVLGPQGSAEANLMRTECLVLGPQPSVDVQIRFLHVVSRQACHVPDPNDEARLEPTASLTIDGDIYPTWQEVVERELTLEHLQLSALLAEPQRHEYAWQASESRELLRDRHGNLAGVFQRRQQALHLAVTVSAAAMAEGLVKLTVEIANLTAGTEPAPAAAQLQSLVSAHTILSVQGGRFLSLLEPDAAFAAAVAACRNVGTWPVLVGDQDRCDTLLSSPIILYDFPQIAPESRGDFFDGTEMDEMLTLRVRTLTDAEKREMRHVDERTRQLLDRAESMERDELGALHGAIRSWDFEQLETRPRLETIACAATQLRVGSRVRLRPKRSADVMDIVLAGQVATIEAIEQDYEDHVHLAVVIDGDPGRDLGLLRLPGHRFFYSLDEVEPLDEP